MTRCAVVAVLVMFLCACESEEAKQHHLYYLKQCVEQAYQADNFEFEQFKNDAAMGYDKVENRQGAHDYGAADCMAHAEKTTIEYQRSKHDDYGKVCGLHEQWSFGSCIPK